MEPRQSQPAEVTGSPTARSTTSVTTTTNRLFTIRPIEQQQTPNSLRPSGYRGLSKFISSDPDFMVFRRFGALNIRNLLYLQDTLCELESQLDARDDAPGTRDRRRSDPDGEREKLMMKVGEVLGKYNDALLAHSHILRLHPAPQRERTSLVNWLNLHSPLVATEQQFLSDPDDLLTLSPEIKSTVAASMVEKLLWKGESLRKVFRKRNSLPSQDVHRVLYYPSTLVPNLVRGLVILSGTLALVVPMIILAGVDQRPKLKLGIVAACIVLFSTVIGAVTRAKNWEVLAATAAYSAVLVVFLGASH